MSVKHHLEGEVKEMLQGTAHPWLLQGVPYKSEIQLDKAGSGGGGGGQSVHLHQGGKKNKKYAHCIFSP
jgi:hypothetical protein